VIDVGRAVTATVALPIRLTLSRPLMLGPRAFRVRGRLTENGRGVAGRRLQLIQSPGRAVTFPTTGADGSFSARLTVRRTTTVYAVARIGEETDDSNLVTSNRVRLRPRG